MGPSQIDVRSDLYSGRGTAFVSIGVEAKDKSMDHATKIDPTAVQLISGRRP